MNDIQRAELLGISVDEFQRVMGTPNDTVRLEHSVLRDILRAVGAGALALDEQTLAVFKKLGKTFKNKEAFIKYMKKIKELDKQGKIKSKAGGGNYHAWEEGGSVPIPIKVGTNPTEGFQLQALVHWDRVPKNEEEKAIYYGFHIHSEDNPFGLHSHMIGGPLTGAHTHSPANLLGSHTHKSVPSYVLDSNNHLGLIQIDGKHTHKDNKPDGGHEHMPENFA
jgi:hypothetical protein